MTIDRPVLLVVDDEPGILDLVSRFAGRAGFDVLTCHGGREALEHLRAHKTDIALVDMRMPEVGGFEVLREIRTIDPSCQVILMTGHATIDTAVEAIRMGAVDYLGKPLDFPRLQHLLTAAREEIERQRALLHSDGDLVKQLEFCGMIGRSPRMQELFGLVRRLAPHARTALLTGEPGVGKELLARALHRLGPRRDRRFMALNCSAVVPASFDSELFGHVRGAFTGAIDHQPGLFEVADGGTVFLDEVAELPLGVQAKLLRVLEHGELHRVGSLDVSGVDVHVLSATTRDLRAEVAAGRFRSDLFYRLNIIELQVPPLRERREDIPYLVAAFAREMAIRLRKPIVGPTPSAERALCSATWPGNVRELRNVVERACILADGEFLSERELTANVPTGDESLSAVQAALGDDTIAGTGDLLAIVEREHIVRALDRARGNKKLAARILGLSRRALYRRLERHGLDATITRRGGEAAEEGAMPEPGQTVAAHGGTAPVAGYAIG